MSRVEQRFLLAWVALLALTAILFALPWLIALLILTVVGIIIALPLMLVPSAALYLGAILGIYWPIRLLWNPSRSGRVIIALLSLVVTLFAGIVSAFAINNRLKHDATALLSKDIGTQPLLPVQGRIGLVSDAITERRCDGNCQRLLYRGLTREVLVMPPDGLAAAIRNKPFLVGRHERVRKEEGCGKALLGRDFLTSKEWNNQPEPPLIWDYQNILSEEGECLRSSESNDPRATAYLVDIWNFAQLGRHSKFNWVPQPRWKRQEVLLRGPGGWTRLFRKTEVKAQLLTVPIVIDPPFEFDVYSPGGLSTGRTIVLGADPELDGMLGPLIRNDLTLPDLARYMRHVTGSPEPSDPSTTVHR